MISTDALQADVLDVRKKGTMRGYFFVKRAFDLLFAFVALVPFALLTVVIKIAYILSGDFAPIFYCHKRIGKNGKEFMLYKFRTMVPNSAEVLEKLLKKKAFREEWEACHKLENDPRITKIGKLLRKTSVDEIPQTLNIIKGDMSLIGPRPVTKPEVDAYGKDQTKLLSLRPGLTGWWACNGRSGTDHQSRQELELFYCENASLLLDIKCFLKTISAVIKQEGAK